MLETADELMGGDRDPPQVKRMLHQALELARANLDETRRSVLDLRAAPLEGRGLADALAKLCRDMTAGGSLRVEFVSGGASQPLPGRLEAGLYRIAQEALSNVEQHSRASQAWVRLSVHPEHVVLVVEDDGQGFDPAQTEPGHYGILGLTERARLMGGTLDLRTGVGEGTRVEVSVPRK
jgi:two-component system NarL family sensor kinase